MVIKQSTGVQASVKVLGVKENSQKGVTNLYVITFSKVIMLLVTENLVPPPLVKAPKTIHRCILKTSLSTKSGAGGASAELCCHVCLASYADYNTYFRHLVDRSCVRQPRVDKTVWNTSVSIYAPHNTVQVVFFKVFSYLKPVCVILCPKLITICFISA